MKTKKIQHNAQRLAFYFYFFLAMPDGLHHMCSKHHFIHHEQSNVELKHTVSVRPCSLTSFSVLQCCGTYWPVDKLRRRPRDRTRLHSTALDQRATVAAAVLTRGVLTGT